jgi:DNA invertase Pin-like site-specific DNA recombinase
MRVALYARVSTKDKDQDPETQLLRLREYMDKKHGADYQREEYVDYASGSSLSEKDRRIFKEIERDTKRYMAMRKRQEMGQGTDEQKGLEEYP